MDHRTPQVSDCSEMESTLTKIVQVEQFMLFFDDAYTGGKNTGDDIKLCQNMLTIINEAIHAIKINTTKQRAEEKALRDCGYKSHLKYLNSMYKGYTREIHKYAQELNVRSNLYQRDYNLYMYKGIIDEIKSKERLIIINMPLLYKIYIKGEKTTADIVISYLDLCDLGYDIDELYILHKRVYRYHNNAIENEEYYHGYDKTIILDSNIDITNWMSNTLCLLR